MTRPTTCQACGGEQLVPFHRSTGAPTNSCLLLEDAEEARRFPTGDLDLVFCRTCGFVANAAFDPALSEYSGRYEETQGFSETFVDFGRELAKCWVDDHDLHGRNVLEIGCGKGEFLTWMVEAGAGHGVGIDPGVHPERLSGEAAEQITWIADFYDDRHADLEAEAVVCRHTLEHIQDVGGFLRMLRRNIGARLDTVLLFELPDALRVFRDLAFWDVYYEHCSYFTAGSLARLFRSTGFEVLSVAMAYDEQYLLVEARPADDGHVATAPHPLEEQPAELWQHVEAYARDVDHRVSALEDRMARVVGDRGRVALWGGGSKAVALLTALDDPGLVDVVVDINPHKQGRYIAGTGHEVAAPVALRVRRPDLVIAMNSVYVPEIRAQLDELGVPVVLEGL